jgi:benzoyl-CoA reductase subunit A
MNVVIGVDLGSTTTKAVVVTEDEEILGRGITNSRNNYDVACEIAQSEAVTTARFAILSRAIGDDPALAPRADTLVPALETRFRREQHGQQLAALRAACLDAAAAAEDREPVAEILDAMETETAGLFVDGARGARAQSDFFRDVAASQYLQLAEAIARRGRSRFERMMSAFDKAILKVENAPPDLSFESNVRGALRRVGEEGIAGAGPAPARLAAAVEVAAATPLDVASCVGTGYGRVRLPFPKERIRSEILCHGLGAHFFFPGTATVLDIGGQDTKAIQIDADGIVTSFQMNDRCAAGCGRYLGYIADEMSLGVQELGPLALQSRRPTRIASTCTVFAGAELRDRLSLGERREDILAGLHRAIILRAVSLLSRSGGIRDEFTFTGGVARNPAALAALRQLVVENYGARTLNVSPDSIYTGAVGAALFARRAAQEAAA